MQCAGFPNMMVPYPVPCFNMKAGYRDFHCKDKTALVHDFSKNNHIYVYILIYPWAQNGFMLLKLDLKECNVFINWIIPCYSRWWPNAGFIIKSIRGHHTDPIWLEYSGLGAVWFDETIAYMAHIKVQFSKTNI